MIQFRLWYYHTLKGKIEDLSKLVDSDLLQREASEALKKPEELLKESIENAMGIELGFANKVISYVNNHPGTDLYWSLEHTVLYKGGSAGLHGNIIRPVAPMLMEYLGRTNGIFSAKLDSWIVENLAHENKLNSIAPYTSKEHFKRDKKDSPEKPKHEVFVNTVKEGLLIDDQQPSIALEEIGRGVCVYEYSTIVLHYNGPTRFIHPTKYFQSLGTGI